MKKFDVVAAVLLVIGGLNWALVGAAVRSGSHHLRHALRRSLGAEFRGVPAGRAVGWVPSRLMEGDSAPLGRKYRHRTQPLTLSGRAAA